MFHIILQLWLHITQEDCSYGLFENLLDPPRLAIICDTNSFVFKAFPLQPSRISNG
jgi:hypothetical protein